jgi:hypothetical protein
MAVTADGDVGDGEYRALGHNDEDDKLVPTKLDHDLFQGWWRWRPDGCTVH